jgi:hypothetical protein
VSDDTVLAVRANMTPIFNRFVIAPIATRTCIEEFLREEFPWVIVVVRTAITAQPEEG